MSSPINFTRFLSLIDQYLVTRITPNRISGLNNLDEQLFGEIAKEIDKVISAYNSFVSGDNIKYVNAGYLKKIYSSSLPIFSSILTLLSDNPVLLASVMSEMRDSTYFHHIYMIDPSEHLLANLMTLIYRNTILIEHSELREKNAQVSSTLEEMSALLYLQGIDTHYFHAIKDWILDWEGEGFSQELASLVNTAQK